MYLKALNITTFENAKITFFIIREKDTNTLYKMSRTGHKVHNIQFSSSRAKTTSSQKLYHSYFKA